MYEIRTLIIALWISMFLTPIIAKVFNETIILSYAVIVGLVTLSLTIGYMVSGKDKLEF